MAKLFFIRHGRAAKGWGDDPNPSLAAAGFKQANAAAAIVAAKISKIKIIASPMQRCQETALPLCALWGVEAQIVNAVSEIPTPRRLTLADRNFSDRADWLKSIMSKSWAELAGQASLLLWKKHLLDWAYHQKEDCVVFSHFIAINAVLGATLSEDAFIVCRPNYCSLWEFDNKNGLALVEPGAEMETKVL